MTHMVRYIV